MRTIPLLTLFILFTGFSCREVINKPVLTGAGRFDLYVGSLEGKAVGLLGNHTSMVGDSHLVDTLLSLGINIEKIFSPEHGFRGLADAGEHIENGTDIKTGIPIVSLYGSHRQPTDGDMEGIEVLVFDLQDVGTRFYTYISTLQLAMEKCAELNIQLVLLDRPNPNGFYVDGPLLDTAFRSFVGMQQVPVVHGMTTGEYAMMLNGEGWLSGGRRCDLVVIPCLNYTHSTFYNLPVGPSPNLPNQTSVYLYPSLCFFEGTVISCGRGTDRPFQVFGHPLLKGYPYSFTPVPGPGAANPVLGGQECFGTDLSDAIEKGIVPSPGINLEWLLDAYRDFPDRDNFFNNYFNTLAGGTALREMIESGCGSEEIKASWQADLESFRVIRKKYLLYRE